MAPLKNSRQRLKARLGRVRRLIGFIEETQNGSYLRRQEAITRQIFPEDYIELLKEVDKRDSRFQNYFHGDVRYQYRESRYGKKQFTVFTPSAFHIYMQASIDSEVVLWSDRVKNNSDNTVQVRTAVDRIQVARETSIKTDNKLLRPDCSFRYIRSKGYPPVAFVIAWSQTTDALKKRAIELIQESAGGIRTVVALDFSETHKIWTAIWDRGGTEEFPDRGPATGFMWRAMFEENGEQIFDTDGSPSLQEKSCRFCDDDDDDDDDDVHAKPSAALQLSLKDFIPLPVIKAENWDGLEALSDTKLDFDSVRIARYLNEALDAQKQEDEGRRPKRERKARENTKAKQEREAKKKAAAEEERGHRPILDMVNIGGHSLRRGVRSN
ncbi:hypothetical protein F5X97DRAFT_342398 [Nemania serpens]|nr:hypothetical protein F5X97DRAFT_342398 [Nemania serpens]